MGMRMGEHVHDDHKKDDVLESEELLKPEGGKEKEKDKPVEDQTEKEEELTEITMEDRFGRVLDVESQPLIDLIHPACHRYLGSGPRGQGDPNDDQIKYTTASYQELSDLWYESLKEKNHLYGLRSGISRVRTRTVTAHKDWFDKKMPEFPDPDDETQDKEFKEAIAVFLTHSGHYDWAVNIPGID